MSLINCPECKKEISDKAASCPNCGMPISQMTKSEDLLQCPNFPDELSIGHPIVNWGGDSALKGFYDGRENTVESIRSGNVTVLMHTHGIEIIGGTSYVKIHNSQIISIKKTTRTELTNLDKSVVGRAVVGGLILGPFGAVIGGMSGIGSKEKIEDKSYLVINFWEKEAKKAQTILISSEKNVILSFIQRHKKEQTINMSENRQASKNSGCLSIIMIPILFGIVYLTLL